MLSCIIVEDEFPAREELKFFINSNNNFQIDKEFENPIDALKYIEKNNVDVVFLDINMSELDGMSLGKIIHKFNKNIKLVFTTAYREYAVDAFEIKAFDYILKPYSEERIIKALDNLVEEFTDTNKNGSSKEFSVKKLTVNLDSKMFVLSIEDILYIEADEKETHIFTKDNMYFSKLKISQLENILSENIFFRCHRSYIVNLDKIIEVEPWFNATYILKVSNCNFKIPVSRNHVKKLKEILTIR
ncbi:MULTISPECIES: LytR/AlgR family response regulator transcription factor [Cetobacterium]|jgi:two-component system LytT family response regulator|uniref:LytTR family DNA-binding domain-containing protein n=1 Tax=Candidatus Cetobacterium colombiensis TaxID=3073100 RepID=A0ABU4W7E3_9FUSO|nr:LytTR family DNA-binding domain-containing protein [Candidatus Cetobacterium colombiensis]MDX8335446.1 LytTR family DNA-binding domain-containing protein [Candidatus Cetobacterium colombiensis]